MGARGLQAVQLIQLQPCRTEPSPKFVTIPWQTQDTAWVGQSTPPGQAEGGPLKGTPILPSHSHFCLPSALLAEHFHQLP